MLKILTLLLISTTVLADPALEETRYCGQPLRNADGSIHRRSDVLSTFKRIHPCPSTGKTTGACSGWSIDHVVPLVSCGCDAVYNLQWLKNEVKSCAGVVCKDRWERVVYTCEQVPK